MMDQINNSLVGLENASWLEIGIILTILLALTVTSYWLAKQYLLKLINKALAHSQPTWKKVLERHQPFKHLIYMVPTLFLYFWLQYLPTASEYLTRILNFYIIVNVTLLLGNLIASTGEIYKTYPIAKEKPIKTYLQLLSLFIYLIGGVVSIFVLLNIDPSGFLGSVGVLTTVLLFVFRDTILSFIAGMQIVTNKLIQTGDWVEAPQFGVNGYVQEVALHVIKVQNFDKTIVSVPTYKLVDAGFKNYRGMYDSGGRRIKRALLIDQTSVRLLSKQKLEEILKAPELADILKSPEWVDEPESGLKTNLGAFRSYVEAFLKHHPKINQSLICMTRLLDPTAQGIPLEIYVFTSDTAWPLHERVQAEIFEQLIATVPLFGLRIFQDPSGYDYIVSGIQSLSAANVQEVQKSVARTIASS